MSIEEFSDIRRSILLFLKQSRSATIAEIASQLDVTYEGVRQQVVQLEREGWIVGRVRRGAKRTAGRPINDYALTLAGDHLFPKNYDLLAITVIDTVGEQLGMDALKVILASVTEAQVAKWEPLMRGKSLIEKIGMLRNLYEADDPFMEFETTGGELRLIERNCPYLNVAMRHPALCSTSVSVLTRLLGVRVVREERFQSGDQRCVFRVLHDQPVDPSTPLFNLELPISSETGRS